MKAVKLPFADLTQELQQQAVIRYSNARKGDGYLYEVDIRGRIICRSLCWSAYSPDLA